MSCKLLKRFVQDLGGMTRRNSEHCGEVMDGPRGSQVQSRGPCKFNSHCFQVLPAECGGVGGGFGERPKFGTGGCMGGRRESRTV